MENNTKRTIGAILIVIGAIGLFVPFLQGIALIVIGLGLLGYHFSKKKKAKT